MESAEALLVSKPVQEALRQMALAIKWGKITIDVQNGKIVISKIEKTIKHS